MAHQLCLNQDQRLALACVAGLEAERGAAPTLEQVAERLGLSAAQAQSLLSSLVSDQVGLVAERESPRAGVVVYTVVDSPTTV